LRHLAAEGETRVADGTLSYLIGVNYPWREYGRDFGTNDWGHAGAASGPSRAEVEADFANLQSLGVRVVRWWLFGDGRAAPEFSGTGQVTDFDSHFYADLDAVLDIALRHNIKLILVLLDFGLAEALRVVDGVQTGGHAQLIADPEKRRSFLNNGLQPLLQRYGDNVSILAWDVINEPEGAMDIPGGAWVAEPIAVEIMQAFVKEAVRYIHIYSSQYATVGSAQRRWLNYWTDSGLDFYQYHYYDHLEADNPLDQPYNSLNLDKPAILGEFPTHDTTHTVRDFLDTAWSNGYAGALAWSYRAEDQYTDFKIHMQEFADWIDAHGVEMDATSWPL